VLRRGGGGGGGGGRGSSFNDASLLPKVAAVIEQLLTDASSQALLSFPLCPLLPVRLRLIVLGTEFAMDVWSSSRFSSAMGGLFDIVGTSDWPFALGRGGGGGGTDFTFPLPLSLDATHPRIVIVSVPPVQYQIGRTTIINECISTK